MNISIPAESWIYIVASTSLIVRYRDNLLGIIVGFSVFQSASVLDIGIGGSEISVPPWIAVTLMAATYTFVIRRRQRNSSRKVEMTLDGPASGLLVIFIIYSVASAFICPFVFQGMPVIHTRHYGDPQLTFGSSNIAQAVYLLMNGLICFWCARRTNLIQKRQLMEAFVAACLISAGIGLYQYLSQSFNLWYPSAFLYSNQSYVIHESEKSAGLIRINATFSEASIAALYFAAAAGVCLMRCRHPNSSICNYVKSCIFVVALFLTVSTTAYITLLIALGVFVLKSSFDWNISSRTVIIRLMSFAALVGTAVFVVDAFDIVSGLNTIYSTVFGSKEYSESYIERHQWDVSATNAFFETRFIGAGLGSVRASSAVLQLLGSVGIIGSGAFAFFVGRILYLARRSHDFSLRRQAVAGSMLMLVAHSLSVPELSFPALWALFGVALVSRRPARPSIVEKRARDIECSSSMVLHRTHANTGLIL